MQPTRKGLKVQNNAWGASKAPGTARSNTTVPTIVKPSRTDAVKANPKANYVRKGASLSTTAVPKNRTPDTTPQPYNKKGK